MCRVLSEDEGLWITRHSGEQERQQIGRSRPFMILISIKCFKRRSRVVLLQCVGTVTVLKKHHHGSAELLSLWRRQHFQP
ncbi:uncharacterized [Tachysurus ichikawai]